MKSGLISDIHEHADNLRECLRLLQAEGVDQIVMLGDVYELGQRIRPTCQLLAQANVAGVWGNHDCGLCDNPTAEMHQNYGDVVIDYTVTGWLCKRNVKMLPPKPLMWACHGLESDSVCACSSTRHDGHSDTILRMESGDDAAPCIAPAC